MISLTIPPHLHAIELSTICTNQSNDCTIDTQYKNQTIENNHNLTFSKITIKIPLNNFINNASLTFGTGAENSIHLETDYTIIQNFINNGTIRGDYIYLNNHKFTGVKNFYNYGTIHSKNSSLQTNIHDGGEGYGFVNIYNYGYMSGGMYVARSGDSGTTHLYNYGEMGGIWTSNNSSKTAIVDNLGIINFGHKNLGYHFDVELVLKNYAMKITENAIAFNGFSGNAEFGNNSHLIIANGGSVSFADSSAKMILDFGGNFSFGKEYLLEKLIVDKSGKSVLNMDFDRLVPRSDIYFISQQGDKFVVNLKPESSTIGNLYKSNVRTMNNFYTISNSMIYPRKSYHFNNITDSALDSAIPLKSYESFSYRSEAQNRRIQRQNKRNYNRKTTNAESSVKSQSRLPRATSRTRNDNFNNSVNDSQNLNADSANHQSSSLRADSQNLRGNPQNQNTSQNQSQNPHDYYFILTPFINHNLFFESGRYNLSGFDYGFLTAFSAQVAESNHLGTHFIFSYGKLGDKQDKNLSIKTLNLNLGLNYKLDLIWDMYLKARGDFFYFLNAIDSLTIKNIKPNNLGFGLSMSYGKDFDFKSGGVLGLEVGLDYKALKTNEVLLNSQNYKQSLLNLIYANLGINYNKYFDSFGINVGTGFKANLAPKLAESALLVNTQTLKFTLDNDKYLGYANAGISYVLNTKNFDMEFSIAYYGNFGDRAISNGGGMEWRVNF